MQRLASWIGVGALLASATLAQTLVIPAGTATAEGNSSNAFPWGRGGTGILISNLYDSVNFTSQGVTAPIQITGLRWRIDSAIARTWVNSNYGSASVSLSTCPVDQASALAGTPMSTYEGIDKTTCYNGPVSWLAGSTTAPGPSPTWQIDVPLTTPFIYNPALGDLNIETDIPIQTFTGTAVQLDVQTTGSNSSRVYITTGYPTGATAVTLNHGVVVELTYTPAVGLFAAFNASATTGNAPFAVNFTSTSFTSDPGGITAYAWDFDGDNVIDSTAANPTFVYNNCGTYPVSLTVFDASNPADTETKAGYITIDPISASFTVSPAGGFAPLIVNFTDTSSGPVSGWAWDFDNDTVIDSTSQNPVWAYGTPGQYTVSLTVTNSCRTSTVTRTNLVTVLAPGVLPAPPELLQYQFNEVRGQEIANTASTNAAPAQATVGAANWWSDPGRADFRGNEPGFGCLGYRATGAGWVNTGIPTTFSGSFSIAFWLRRDVASTGTNPFGYAFGNATFRAFAAGAAGQGITFRGSAIGNVDSSFTVTGTPGVWQHLTLVVDDAAGQARWYSDGVPSTTVVSFTPNTFAYTSATQFAVGAQAIAGGSPIGTHYSMDDFRFYTRALSASDVLTLAFTSENATAGVSGLSCPGTLGVPVIGSTGGAPTQGNAAFAVTLSNAEDLKLAAIAMGFTPAAFGTFDLSPWLGAGCVLQNDAAALNFTVTSGNAASQAFGLPSGTGLTGLHVYAQWAVLGTTGAATKMIDINIR